MSSNHGTIPDWSTKLFKTAQNSPCYGEDNDNPKGGKVMFRHYYVNNADGTTGHTLQAVDIEYENVIKQEADKEATLSKAEESFKNASPNSVELLKTEVAEIGEIDHPKLNR